MTPAEVRGTASRQLSRSRPAQSVNLQTEGALSVIMRGSPFQAGFLQQALEMPLGSRACGAIQVLRLALSSQDIMILCRGI